MPVYAFACSEHDDGRSFESEGYLPRYDSENPACGLCGKPTERVWRGRQHHGELSGWPMTTRMLDGVERRYDNLGQWEKAVKDKGLRIRADSSWLDEDVTPTYNWKTKRTEYRERHTTLGGKGCWF